VRKLALAAAVWISLGGLATSAAEEVRFPLPDVAVEVDHLVKIGELENLLTLDATVSSILAINGQRVDLEATFSEPALYPKLMNVLTSRAKTGCSVVHREGSGRGAFEAELCNVRDIRVTFDRAKGTARLQATAKIRNGIAGVGAETSTHDVTLEAAPSVRNGVLILEPKSLHVTSLPDALGQSILESLEPASIPLHRCLAGLDLEVEDLTFETGANQINVAASTKLANALSVVPCFTDGRLILHIRDATGFAPSVPARAPAREATPPRSP
jgi:hypothetical protein